MFGSPHGLVDLNDTNDNNIYFLPKKSATKHLVNHVQSWAHEMFVDSLASADFTTNH